MQDQNFTKKDWKLFQEKLPDWQEAYMGKLLQEYSALLNGEGNPSERFWELDKRVKKDKRCPGVQLEVTKSKLIDNILALLRDDVITMDDLADFSEELKGTIQAYVEMFKRWGSTPE
jgi:hypothetical protein